MALLMNDTINPKLTHAVGRPMLARQWIVLHRPLLGHVVGLREHAQAASPVRERHGLAPGGTDARSMSQQTLMGSTSGVRKTWTAQTLLGFLFPQPIG